MAQVVPIARGFAESDHERLIAALKASRAGTWRWTLADDRVEWDTALCEVYGIKPENAPRTSAEFLALIHPEDRDHARSAIGACIEGGKDADYQFRAVVDGTVRWIYDRSALVRHPDGSPAYMLGACLDVTETRRVQDERDAALAKQKVLLNELSHKVKNHLALIVSMLRLKRSKQTDPGAAEDFSRAIERAKTIASLHEYIYRSGEVESVSLNAYLEEICKNLEAEMLAGGRVSIVRAIEPVKVTVDWAVPIGLIVNELITNSARHGFAPGQAGEVRLRVRTVGDRVVMTVADNGHGMASVRSMGVGTRLMRALADQIGARMRLMSGRGTICSLSFPRTPPPRIRGPVKNSG